MTKARAVFLSKDPNDTTNPLAQRIQKITSAIYREWAGVRTRNLEDWIETWDHKSINSGMPGKGAMDGWYYTAFYNELSTVSNNRVSGGSIDIYKCFDQLNKPLIYKLAKKAGMPLKIVDACYRIIDNPESSYQISRHLGNPEKDR